MGLPHAAGDRPHQAEPLDAVEISACQAEWEDGDVVETVARRILGYLDSWRWSSMYAAAVYA